MAKPLLSLLSVLPVAAIALAASTALTVPSSARAEKPVRVASRFAQAPAPAPTPESTMQRQADRLKSIGEIALPGPLPAKQPTPDFAQERFEREPREVHGPGASREWPLTVYAWESPAFCHRPLYFEDENLERYGYSYGAVQPAVSAAHFFGRAVTWPYLMGAFPPHDCTYTLGKGRPGSYMPYYLYRPPVSARGALYEAGAITGLSFFVP
jgi:hypothetical protein